MNTSRAFGMLSILLLTFFIVEGAHADGIDIKGVKLGAQFVVPPAASCGPGHFGETECKFPDGTSLSVYTNENIVKQIVYRFASNTVPTVTSPIGAALIQKFGQPASINGAWWKWEVGPGKRLDLSCDRVWQGFCDIAAEDENVDKMIRDRKQNEMQLSTSPKF